MSGTAKHYISLFTGAGGLDIGFNEAGFHGLLASDIMPQAKETFILNYPDEPYLLEDIRTLSISEIKKYVGDKKVSVIIGGPPCQGFSNMGNKNSADPRNMLFESYVKIVDAIRPTCFLFENVKGLRTMFEGRYFKKVIEGFLAIGYNLHYALVDTSNYGVPQKRERIIIFGTMLDKQFLFPVFNADSFGRITAYKNVGEAINDLTDKGEEVPNHIALNHSDIVVRRYELIPEGGKLPKPEFLPEDIRRKNFGNTYTRLSRNEVSSTIVPGNNALPVHPTLNRRYTGSVSAGDIRDFRGSLTTDIEKGVFITTGSFTKAAREEASNAGKQQIDLIDGEEFISKLIEYGLGVKERTIYEVDKDFFERV